MTRSHRFEAGRFWVMALMLVLVAAMPPAVHAEEGFTIEDVLASPFPTSVTASETGSRVAWVFTLRGVANVWVAEGPDFEGRQLTAFTADDGRPLDVLGFAPDNEWVFFAKSSRFNPDQRALGSGPSKLSRVAWAGGEPEELAEAESAVVSPVEAKLAFVKGEKELWLVEPGEEPVKIIDARGELSQPRWSPDGKKLVMATMRGQYPHRYSFITVYDIETEEIRYLDASDRFGRRTALRSHSCAASPVVSHLVWSPRRYRIPIRGRSASQISRPVRLCARGVRRTVTLSILRTSRGSTNGGWSSARSGTAGATSISSVPMARVSNSSRAVSTRSRPSNRPTNWGGFLSPAIVTTSTAATSGRWTHRAR